MLWIAKDQKKNRLYITWDLPPKLNYNRDLCKKEIDVFQLEIYEKDFVEKINKF